MRQLVMDSILQNLKNVTEEYKDSIQNTLDNFITYTQLPKVFQQELLDTHNLPKKCNTLYSNITETINTKCNIGIKVESYKECGFIVSTILGKYLKDTILNDEHLSTVLYIDTNLLLEDYKKLMDRNTSDDSAPSLVHSLDILNKQIEVADFVFWDKFTMMQSNYELMKIYDILSIRYRNCLGNIFFMTPDYVNVLSKELTNVMNLLFMLNFTEEEYQHIK